MIYRVYGQVVFASAKQRTTAMATFDSQATTRLMVPDTIVGFLSDGTLLTYGPGSLALAFAGKPGFHFCYSTQDEATAMAAVRDLQALGLDEPSGYGFAASSV